MIVLRADAVALCLALGFATAGNWNRQRMRRKLVDLAEMRTDNETEIAVDEDHDDAERLNALLDEIAEAGGEVDLVEKMPEPAEDAGQDDLADAEPEQDQTEPDEATKKPDDEQEAMDIEEGGPEKTDKDKSSDEKPQGIRPIHNRLFYAGVILREHGLEAGLSDDLIAKLDEACGKPNPNASKSQLRYAWHIVNGFLNG